MMQNTCISYFPSEVYRIVRMDCTVDFELSLSCFYFQNEKRSEYFLQTLCSDSIIILSEFLLPKLVKLFFIYTFVIDTTLFNFLYS